MPEEELADILVEATPEGTVELPEWTKAKSY
jgi:hypothetical protein